MHLIIISVLLVLAVISIGPIFADNSLISVVTSDDNYKEGDTILISGNVSTLIGNTQVTLQLFKEGNLVEIAQVKVAQDGNYFHNILAQGPLWQNPGEYLVKAVYGEGNSAETLFQYVSKSDIIETTTNFEVNAGDSGTFDIQYSIRGGTLENIKIEPNIFGLIVTINALDDGSLVLELPRQFIDAEKQNAKDEKFIILIDDIETIYSESKTYSEIRTITINFEEGDSEIQIIGTYVIPEFGTIVMIILTIGIMASILLTKNKFQIKI